MVRPRALAVLVSWHKLVYLVAATSLVTTAHAVASNGSAASDVTASSCAPTPLGTVAPAPALVVKALIPKGTRGSVILSEQLYVPTTLPCRERVIGAIVDPAYLKGRAARTDLFPGQQLTRPDFSGSGVEEAVPMHAACPAGSETNPVSVLLVRRFIRAGTPGSTISQRHLYRRSVLPCWERWRGAVIDPAFFRGRVARQDLLLGQQFIRSQFSRRP